MSCTAGTTDLTDDTREPSTRRDTRSKHEQIMGDAVREKWVLLYEG